MLPCAVRNNASQVRHFRSIFQHSVCGKSLVTKELPLWHSLSTSVPKLFRFDDMAQPRVERVLVKLQKNGESSFENAHFTQCLVDALSPGNDDGVTECNVEMHHAHLHISTPTSGMSPIKMKHPSFCPIHNMKAADHSALPDDIYMRGIDCGAAIILEAGDGRVLLTRRGDNLRTFPGIWVPPGGHIEQNESFAEAGLRELREETGLEISEQMCSRPVQALAVWESVFPPKLSLGQPFRHHAVIYLHAKLKPGYTSSQLSSNINMDPSEVGACAWFDKSMAEVIVSAREDETVNLRLQHSIESFSAQVLNENNEQCEQQLPFSDLLKTAGDDKDHKGRVSTGTKFALEEWLALT